ncbi:MAG: DNA polymerase III subunit gamma and tau [Nocardioidaceae bacterium]|nr:DNA polymerase III subunit gamma and tau [Nocardioidaceae bacterium]
MDAPLALYRRYRPDLFDDVIGQDHVTTPLAHALENNRVHHAYLFSGPRGCGKTTSARIMARALNCELGPTPTPCGKCDSCRELARGGPGSIDVIEIDAASHGGVEDARDLRERAFFAPMKSRYKIYIIDEAHMVTTQGFNALLKLVEEPPGHLRFIFATTEPEKVIGTIKSRTHHYPFRLVPPKVLGDYVLELCTREGVQIEPTVVPLVVRAGAGSVRDSLSVLDQLIGGSGPEGVSYGVATALLGFTPTSLLDETVDALAAGDGDTLFGVIDKVIDTGQDPRRFAEDLLHRLRDLVVVSVVPDAASRGLIELSGDQADRLDGQAARFGRTELIRAADIVSQGLTDMRGATAPRLLLEMMCARILLPGADATPEGFGARLDRIERRLSVADPPRDAGRQPAEPDGDALAQTDNSSSGADRGASAPPLLADPDSRAPLDESAVSPTLPADSRAPGSTTESAKGQAAAASPATGGLTLVDVRQLWPGVLERVKKMRRYAWILLSQNAQVTAVADGVITVGFVNAGARDNFTSSGADEILRQALIDELGVDWRVEGIIDGSTDVTGPRAPPRSAPTSASTAEIRAAKEAIRPTRRATAGDHGQTKASVDDVHEDDEVVEDSALTSQELLARELGAEIIDDIRHDSA